MKFRTVNFFLLILIFSTYCEAQQLSKARVWNEVVLGAIRNDFARPTVHARNLFHTSIAMYDAFAAYDDDNETYFLGNTIGEFTCEFEGVPEPYLSIQEAREMAMSYAVFRIIEHRFADSPGADDIMFNADLVFNASGYDKSYTETDYTNGFPAALGNYIGEQIIAFGLQDGSNEINDYENQYYESVNPVMDPSLAFEGVFFSTGNKRINDPNRWQKLDIPGFVDQAGNVTEGGSPSFLSPEWGRVLPFALTENDLEIRNKDGNDWWLYHNPGDPFYIDTIAQGGLTDEYKWGFSMVVNWKTHTIQDTAIRIDISPGSIGNITEFPTTTEGLRDYYDFENGGDVGSGHDLNPITGQAYETNEVIKSDYTRAIAEWWADGPSSETPPGHWFSILNFVTDQDALEKKYKGEGEPLGNLEWDVKTYLALGGAMHDSAISAWSNKGYYDYIRPISAIRWMIDQGQSSDPEGLNYSPNGIPLIPGVIEQIEDEEDILFSSTFQNVGNIKILDGLTTDFQPFARGEFWRPYQSNSFVTPPFAGYVSGHSTFSRAAAEVLSLFTGSDFFPGGIGEVHFEPGDLETNGEVGPLEAFTLQWATYRDAANQSALSRIWGGIHPPVDDIPGRQIGEKVGIAAFEKADALFGVATITNTFDEPEAESFTIYPNPVLANGELNLAGDILKTKNAILTIIDNQGNTLYRRPIMDANSKHKLPLEFANLKPGVYHLQVVSEKDSVSEKFAVMR